MDVVNDDADLSTRTSRKGKQLVHSNSVVNEIYASRVLTSISGRTFQRESGDKEGKDYIIDDVGVIGLRFIFFLQ